MSFTESTNVISLTNALPTSDTNGKVSSEYFDFSVTTNTEVGEGYPNVETSYEITIEPLSVSSGYTALTDSQIKVYLENKDTSSILTGPTLISSLSTSESNTNKVLYSNKHTHSSDVESITTNYRLRAWIDYNVDSSNWTSSTKYEYKFRININGAAEYEPEPTPASCFTYETSGNNAAITDYDENCGTDVVIPEAIDGYAVKVIGSSSLLSGIAYNENINNSILLNSAENSENNYSFIASVGNGVPIPVPAGIIGSFQEKGLTSVVIPDSIEIIGDCAFYNNNLTTL